MAGAKHPDSRPPSASSEAIERMVEEAFRKNTTAWPSEEVDFRGAAPHSHGVVTISIE